ncbi:dual specificity protein phosphatase 1 isoform X3 [Cannabis sativa]|uniref:dual specificity protein phosphatase 1 isoform X3 n=2 Tax=Cannabis sativa TaxID=3483 RepID=UPI0011DFFA07|nr:dual specificity protein phosphatase 1 isoform X3 [Cannabis sativa]
MSNRHAFALFRLEFLWVEFCVSANLITRKLFGVQMESLDESLSKLSAMRRVMVMKRYLQKDKVPSKIEECLFLGSLEAARNKSELKELKITHILTVAHCLVPIYPDEFVYKIISVADKEDTDIKQFFDECFNFIDEAKRTGGSVLVHCVVGKSRSATIVVAYLMRQHGMSLSEALKLVRSKRPIVAPNSGFLSQLKEFEKSPICKDKAKAEKQ